MSRRVFVVAAVVAIGTGVAACGGDDGDADLQEGKQVFADAGCGDCHTLADAGAKGQVGPSLDSIKPDYPDTLVQVTEGGPGMPAFEGRLSDEEREAVARYVSEVAGTQIADIATYEPDDTQLSECHGREDAACYEQAFANLLYEQGPRPALGLLEQRMLEGGWVARGCHRIAHWMGNAALVRFDDDVGKAFAEGAATCSSGYYHGILERAFSGAEDSELGEKAAGLCAEGPLRADPFLAFQCRHGLDHGLMIHTDYDLPLALDTCDALGQPDATTCQDGVFMENFTSSYGVTSDYLREDDLIYPCNDVAAERKYSCYIIVTARILPEVNWNWKRAAEGCRAAEPEWQYACFRSYGRDAISTNAYDEKIATQLCRFTKEWEGECILSVALHIANDEGRLERASRYCGTLPDRLSSWCFAGVGVTAGLLIPNQRQRTQACQSMTRDVQDTFACMTGTVPGAASGQSPSAQ